MFLWVSITRKVMFENGMRFFLLKNTAKFTNKIIKDVYISENNESYKTCVFFYTDSFGNQVA